MLPRKKLKMTTPDEQVVARAHAKTVCYLNIDHCSKIQRGVVVEVPADGEFLVGVTNAVCNAEQWHCDKGEEFRKHSK